MEAAADSGVRRSSPRKPGGGRIGSARRARLAGAVAVTTLLWMLGGMLGGALPATATTTPGPTPAPTSAEPQNQGSVSLSVSPDANGVLGTAQDLGVTVAITNTTDDAVPPGSIHLWLDRTRLSSRTALSGWLTPETVSPQNADSVAVDVPTTGVASGATGVYRAVIPAAAIGVTLWGAYGVQAAFSSPTVSLNDRSVVTWAVGAPASGALVGLIMPLTVTPPVTGLISAADLATDTGPNGVLTQKLDSSIGRAVTLAIDPLVIVSIRALGTAAPQSALNWLARLALAPNETFALAYGNADLALERQAGAPGGVGPTSFDFALDADNFRQLASPDPFALPGQGGAAPGQSAAVESSASSVANATPTATPTATNVPAAGELPTFAELAQWNYTRADIAWPASGTVAADDLGFFAQNALGTSILSTTNLTATNPGVPLSAAQGVDGFNTIVLDQSVTDALQTAVSAPDEVSRGGALATLSATLAVITGETPGLLPTVVASLGSDAPASTVAVMQALDAVETLPWAGEVPLSAATASPQQGQATLLPGTADAGRVADVRDALFVEQQVASFAPVIERPELITGRQRLALISILSKNWQNDAAGLTTATTAYQSASQATLSSVKIVDGSDVNLVATNGAIPVLISNSLDYPVNVRLQVIPSNGRLVVDPSSIGVTIEARSQKTGSVPVKATVASGEVKLRLELFTTDGVLVSQAAPRQINVNADWEGIGTTIVSILLVLLLVFGVVRQVLKQRRARAKRALDAAAAAPGTEPAAGHGEPSGDTPMQHPDSRA